VAISTFQGWNFILFWTFHVKNKIFQYQLKKFSAQIFFLWNFILFYFIENFNISGIDIIQCLVFLSLIKFSPNFNL
jgi:hypothetical protein